MQKSRFGWKIIFFLSLAGLIYYGFYMFSNMGNGLADQGLRLPEQMKEQKQNRNSGGTTLPIPSLLKDKNPNPKIAEFTLNVQKSTMEFFSGKKTNTYGYNGNYLGPVKRCILVRYGSLILLLISLQLLFGTILTSYIKPGSKYTKAWLAYFILMIRFQVT